MTKTSAPDYFRPPYAVTMWCDARAIYVELPMEPMPYIQKFPLTEGGLSKALSAMKDIYRKVGSDFEYLVPKHPAIRRKGQTASPTQLEYMIKILREHNRNKGQL